MPATCHVLSTQGVPVYLPAGYPGSTRWVPERIHVSVEYPGTCRVPVPDKLPDQVRGYGSPNQKQQ